MFIICCNFLSESIKLFRIYCKNELFDLSFWPLGQGHKILFFYLDLYGYYMLQFLAKSIRPFMIYCKIKYLTFDFGFGAKVTKFVVLSSFLYLLYRPNVILSNSFKSFRIYCKITYLTYNLTFDFGSKSRSFNFKILIFSNF